MLSIGNDIVAFGAINVNRTITPNFYHKILAGSELPLYQSVVPGLSFCTYIWLVWSVKEAAYKCLKRLQRDLVFSPGKMTLTKIIRPDVITDLLDESVHGNGIDTATSYQISVIVNKTEILVYSVIYDGKLIHSIALINAEPSTVNWGLKKIVPTTPQEQSATVRSFLSEKTSGQVIKNDLDIPSLINGNDIRPISLSHHYDRVGYALL